MKLIRELKAEKHDGVFSICTAVVVLLIDYVTGKDIQFPILYVLPVGIAAWRDRNTLAYTMSIVLPFVRVGFYVPWHATQSLHIATLNAVITVASLTLYAYLVNRTALQRKQLENKVKTLEGFLPICAWCKKIRNEKGEYEQIEQYITDRSDAQFTHALCPECAKKLYPEITKDERTVKDNEGC